MTGVPTLEAFSTTGMLEAGGVITELFYWELVTAGPEIIRFYEWCVAAVALNPMRISTKRSPPMWPEHRSQGLTCGVSILSIRANSASCFRLRRGRRLLDAFVVLAQRCRSSSSSTGRSP